VINSGLPPGSVNVIYDGVEVPREILAEDRDRARKHFGIPPEAVCIGNVAAFVPEKGHAILLQAFGELRAKLRAQFPGCVLLLCGEGPQREHLLRLAQELQVLDSVKFAAPVSNIEEAFAAMDIFAFPSHEEPLGSALLAAMAHGLPVVAIGRGGVPEVVKHEENGLLVNSLDTGELTAAICSLLAAPEKSRRLGKAARESVLARFSAGHMVDETLRLYELATRERT
jgi:glycosyltransferase involved in cell wall biosynthesis